MREVLRREHPDAVVSISAEVLREYREYERAMTTLVDAAVKPNVGRYVAQHPRPARRLHRRPADPVLRDEVQRRRAVGRRGRAPADHHRAVRPGGRARSARRWSPGAAGFDRVLTCDGGGTSTDVSVVLDGEPTLTTEGTVGAYPSKIPMIDVVTVGAGGGSIAWLSPEGTLKVGPQSAGADPGPLCYGKGGTEPTITDAHVVLGRIPPHLLGGEIPLDVDGGPRRRRGAGRPSSG